MPLLDVILGPKCVDCGNRIKGLRSAVSPNEWICPRCEDKRVAAEQKRRKEEERHKTEREAEERRLAETKRREENQRRQKQAEALLAAAGEGDIPRVDTLIASGADANARNEKGRTALMLAAEKGDVAVVRALIAAGADVNLKEPGEWGMPALYFASNSECVRALLLGGADVNAEDCDGRTALLKPFYTQTKTLSGL